MGKLEDLVPPLELCKQMPQGAFEDSALVYGNPMGWSPCLYPQLVRRDECGNPSLVIAPAPTLEEIMCEMAKYPHLFNSLTCEADGERDFSVYAFVPYRGKPGSKLTDCRDERGATAALKLWMGINGAER